MELTYVFLALLSDQWRVVLLLGYLQVIAFLGTLGSTYSLVHGTASPAIWIHYSSREPILL
jgi:hypothetical protein